MQENVSQLALIVCIVSVFAHECHDLAAFHHGSINLPVDSLGGLDKGFFAGSEVIFIVPLDDAHVTHLVIHACNGFSCVSNISN